MLLKVLKFLEKTVAPRATRAARTAEMGADYALSSALQGMAVTKFIKP
jgi:hypothetical protein